jgi:hypothetical protein
LNEIWFLRFFNFILLFLVNWLGRSREGSEDEHLHLLHLHRCSARTVMVMVSYSAWPRGAVAEVVVPLGLAKAGFLSGCTVVFFFIIKTRSVCCKLLLGLVHPVTLTLSPRRVIVAAFAPLPSPLPTWLRYG